MGPVNKKIQRIFKRRIITGGHGGGGGILLATIICWIQIRFQVIKLGAILLSLIIIR